jgi:FkbM family methyltransferase
MNPLKSRGVRVVLDVGANQGQFAVDFRNAGFDGRIISIEPRSEAFAVLQRYASGDPLWNCR